MSLVFPEAYKRFFRQGTLATAATAAGRSVVTDLLFFRNAYVLRITENAQRSFTTRFIAGASSIDGAGCTCLPELKPNDLCRHVAVALQHVHEDGMHVADRFAHSLWYEVGQLLAEDHGAVEHRRSGLVLETFDGSDLLLRAVFGEGSAASLLSIYPDAVRPEGVLPLSAREQLLRRMVVTPQEAEMAKRGASTRRQLWEGSFWYLFARAAFLYFADHDLTLRSSGDSFVIAAVRGDVELEVNLPRRAVARVLERDSGELARRSGFDVRPGGVAADLRLELRGGELALIPVLLIDFAEPRVRMRGDLARFDRWFFFPDVSFFASAADATKRFAERSAGQQTLLFAQGGDGGYTRDRGATIHAADLFAFLTKHREEIQAMPEALVPQSLRDATPLRLEGPVRFDFFRVGEEIELGVTYAAGPAWISWREIALARAHGDAALIAGNVWIDLSDPQFAWIDRHSETAVSGGALVVSRLEYVRIRSMVRGEVLSTGDVAADDFFESFEKLRSSSGAPSMLELGMDLYGYQQTGYQWLWFLQQNGLGGLLCDDMGLGKTHQAMALLRALTAKHSAARILVVCPTSLLDHWREKLSKYVPGVRFELYYGGRRSLSGDTQAVVTSYGTLRNDAEAFEAQRFDVMILDEAQVIKNRASQTYAALSRVPRDVAIGLSGTPVENHLDELRTLIDFVVPGYLPGETEFDRSFVRPIESGNRAARERLQRLVSPFILRRTKTQVLDQLPPKIVDLRHCELTAEQRSLYRDVVTGRAQMLREQMQRGEQPSYLHIFAVLSQLKQVCNHPASLDEKYAGVESGKWILYRELLDEVLASGLKVVVFSQYVKMLKLIEADLDERGIGWATIKGDTRDRGKMIERFRRDDSCRVFTASLRAGGLGIDLTAASVVIHYDRWWNQAREDQATDRVHRLGQNKGVQVLKLITRGTLEEKIDRIISRKAQLAADVVVEDDPTLVKQFTRDELESLLEF